MRCALPTAICFLGLLTTANAESGLAYDRQELLSDPCAADYALLKDKFEKSKLAYNDGDYFWKDPEPYYFLNGKLMIERYKDLTYANFLLLRKDIAAPYDEWIDEKNYRRIMEGYRHLYDPVEVSELIDYTYNSFRKVNGALFAVDKSKLDRETVATVRFLNQALDRLPPVEAGATLFRCDQWPKDSPDAKEPVPGYVRELFDQKMVGRTYVHRAFMSTTRGVFSAARAKFIDACLFLRVIKTKAGGGGRDVLGYSDQNAYEEEVLFRPGTQLEIKKLEEKLLPTGQTQRILYMEER